MGRLHTVPLISIVDDDESVRTATASLVRSLGFTAYTFASAEEFLRSTHVEETSCLIADVKMPGVNGIELQSLVHAQGRRTSIIFIPRGEDSGARNASRGNWLPKQAFRS